MKKAIIGIIVAITLLIVGFIGGRHWTIYTETPIVATENTILIDHNGRIDKYDYCELVDLRCVD